jgi:hypothetical protein
MEISDIKAGRSYACYFRVTELVDSKGQPIVDRENQTAEKIVQRDVFGVIKTRDTYQQLVEVVDQETGKTHTVGWEDCWGVDEVEWREAD